MTQFIYARTSTEGQNVDIQADLLSKAYPDATVVKEQASATSLNRPELEKLLSNLTAGNELIIYDLSRLSRNTKDFLTLLEDMDQRSVGLIVHNMGGQVVDSQTATGKMILTILTSVNQMQVELMKEKQAIGIAANKDKFKGRPPSPKTAKACQRAIDLMAANPKMTKQEAAQAAGIGVATLYRALKKAS